MLYSELLLPLLIYLTESVLQKNSSHSAKDLPLDSTCGENGVLAYLHFEIETQFYCVTLVLVVSFFYKTHTIQIIGVKAQQI